MKLAKIAFLVTNENMGLCLYIHHHREPSIIYVVSIFLNQSLFAWLALLGNNVFVIYFILAALFLEFWKRYSREITHRWDVTGFTPEEEHPRPGNRF